MTNSIEKGKRGEREWSKFCQKHGFEVRRTQQFCGKNKDAADCVGLPYIHQEVKRVEKLNIYTAIKQAVNDCQDNLLPIVAHKRNNEEWLVTMRAIEWFNIYKFFILYK